MVASTNMRLHWVRPWIAGTVADNCTKHRKTISVWVRPLDSVEAIATDFIEYKEDYNFVK